MTTSTDIRMALKLRYPAQSHALMFEVAPATGGGTRYADAVAFGLWASHGHAIEGVEIKVSRADFLNEMKQPEKSEPVMRYCHRWWLACPKGLVTKDELPPNWGMLELNGGGILTATVKAAKLSPVPVTLPFMAAMMRRNAGLDEEMSSRVVASEVARVVKETKDRLQREHDERLSRSLRQAEDGLKQIETIKEQTGIDLNNYGWHHGGLLEAVKLAHSLGGKYGGISDLRRNLASVMKAIDESGFGHV